MSEDVILKSKENAARRALEFVKEGMIIGVGSGSTVRLFIELLSKEFDGVDLTFVAASYDSELNLIKQGFRLLPLYEVEKIDIAIDGADEVDPKGNLIKGGGAALTREKIIDYFAEKYCIIVDSTKLVSRLFQKHPIPLEVLPESWTFVKNFLETNLRGDAKLREAVRKNGPVITDNGNFILDFHVNPNVEKPPEFLEEYLNSIPGVIENGIFARRKPFKIIVGYPNRVEVLDM